MNTIILKFSLNQDNWNHISMKMKLVLPTGFSNILLKAGKHTDTLPSADYTFYPLKGDSGNMGVIAVKHQICIHTRGRTILGSISFSNQQ